jgi:ABC-2 type transport system permease protein
MTFRALLGRRRALLLLPMPVLLVGLALVGRLQHGHDGRWEPIVLGQLGFGVILPLTALIVGSSVLGLEIEDGTITHVLAKPLPRSEIVLAKLAVAWAVTAVATAVPLAVAGFVAGDAALAAGVAVGAAVGALAYSAVFLAVSLLTRRPVAIGLLYIMLWENLLVRFVSGAKVLSVQEFSITLARGIGGGEALPATNLSTVVAVVLAAGFVVGGTALAANRLRSFSLTGETS